MLFIAALLSIDSKRLYKIRLYIYPFNASHQCVDPHRAGAQLKGVVKNGIHASLVRYRALAPVHWSGLLPSASRPALIPGPLRHDFALPLALRLYVDRATLQALT
jgi:hypothetical protein